MQSLSASTAERIALFQTFLADLEGMRRVACLKDIALGSTVYHISGCLVARIYR
jgi:hypothetical protein